MLSTPGGDRNHGPWIRSPVLYPTELLGRYRPETPSAGLEPTTSRLTAARSNQLSYEGPSCHAQTLYRAPFQRTFERNTPFNESSTHSNNRRAALLAQLVERMTFNHVAVGSSPTQGTFVS